MENVRVGRNEKRENVSGDVETRENRGINVSEIHVNDDDDDDGESEI